MMRASKALMASILVLSAAGMARADAPDPAHTTVMPAVDVSNQPLEKVLDQIRAKVPWFHYVVFRSPTAPADYPKLPVMSLDGVTIEQFLDLVKDQYPSVKVTVIAGEKSPLYSIRIEGGLPASGNPQEAATIVKLEYSQADLNSKEVNLKRVQEKFNSGGASRSEVDEARLAVQLAQAQVKLAMAEHDQILAEANKAQAGATPGGNAAVDKTVVKVYHLVDVLKPGTEPKAAMNDVLSLIQATFDAAGGDARDKPVLNVHAPTQTLIFKGSPEKMQLLEQVLDSLRPKETETTAAVRRELEKTQAALDRSNAGLQETIANLRAANQDRQTLQMKVLEFEAQLEQAHKSATQPSK